MTWMQGRVQGGGAVARATAPLPSSAEVPLLPDPPQLNAFCYRSAKDPLIPRIQSMFAVMQVVTFTEYPHS